MIDEEEYRGKLKNICNEYINPYGDEIILDGKFKLDELKQIVNIMEEFLNQKILKCDFGTDNCCRNKNGFCTDKDTINEGKTCIEIMAWENPY